MRKFLQKLNTAAERFMLGRYGIDELGTFLLFSGLVLALISLFRPLFWLAVPAFVIITFSYVRCFSKNIAKRQSELARFWGERSRAKDKIAFLKSCVNDRTHRYFRCKACRTVMRVPRGKGKIEITCPKCRRKIVKRT